MGILVALILSLLVSFALGVAVVVSLVPDRAQRGVILWLAPAVGLGAGALLNFVWGLVFYPAFAPWLFLGLEAALAVGGVARWWKRSREDLGLKPQALSEGSDEPTDLGFKPQASGKPSSSTTRLQDYRTTRLLVAAAGAAVVLFILVFIGRQIENPFGDWDAWAIWNMRAKHLFLGGENWRNAFNINLHGSDYPALIPYMISRVWSAAGQPTQLAPILIAAVFGLSTLGLLFSLVRSRRGLNQGLLALLVLACTPSFLYWSANQYADVPLGFYFLAGAGCLYLYHTGRPQKPGFLALSGLLAGLAAWTKNEGLFLPAALFACQALLYWRTPRGERRPGEWLWLLAGAAAPVILLVIFKLGVAPSGYVTNQGGAALLARFGEAERYKLIIKSFGRALLTFGRWDVPLIPALLVYFVIVGANRAALRAEKAALALLGGAWLLLMLAYGLAYLITPLPLEWQIGESLERLWLQAYPLGLLLLFLMARNPLDAPGTAAPPTEIVLQARGVRADSR